MNLSFEADLEVTGPDGRLTVSAERGDLVVTTDELRPLIGALRSDGLLPSGSLKKVSSLLADAGATVRLQTPTTSLVTLGAGVHPTAVTRLAGLPHVRIESARGLLIALRFPLRSVAAAAAAAGCGLAVVVLRRHRR